MHEWDTYWKLWKGIGPFRQMWFKEYSEFCNVLGERFNPKVVADVGCGSGVTSIPFAIRGVRVILLDLSREALRVAEKLFDSLNLDAELVAGDLFHLPFSNGCIDLVLNEGILEHFSYDEDVRILEEMGQAGYMVMIIVPWWRGIVYRVVKFVTKLCSKPWPFGGEIERKIKEKELVEMFADSRIKLLHMRGIGLTLRLALLGILLPQFVFSAEKMKKPNLLTRILLSMHQLIAFVSKIFRFYDDALALGTTNHENKVV